MTTSTQPEITRLALEAYRQGEEIQFRVSRSGVWRNFEDIVDCGVTPEELQFAGYPLRVTPKPEGK